MPKSSLLSLAFTRNRAVVTERECSLFFFRPVTYGQRLARSGLSSSCWTHTAGEVLVGAETQESNVINNRVSKCAGLTRPRDPPEFFHIPPQKLIPYLPRTGLSGFLLLDINQSNGRRFTLHYIPIFKNNAVCMSFLGSTGLKLQKCFHEQIKLSASTLRLRCVQGDVRLTFTGRRSSPACRHKCQKNIDLKCLFFIFYIQEATCKNPSRRCSQQDVNK